ncbi:MAG: hypothetical protein MI794_11740 [Pseudomonadales bacterium]|nr:hypothetical protein [Pseudomonadales bacterium]
MRLLLLLVAAIFLAACSLDKNYQDAISFPSEAHIVNVGEWVVITRIVGESDSDTLYTISGSRLDNGESYTLEISWDVAESLKNKSFLVQGRCRNGMDWEKSANEVVTRLASAEDDEGLIIIEILACI